MFGVYSSMTNINLNKPLTINIIKNNINYDTDKYICTLLALTNR